MVWFLVMLLVINVLTYGVVTWVYFRDKHRVDPPKPDRGRAVPSPFDLPDEDHRELRRAA